MQLPKKIQTQYFVLAILLLVGTFLRFYNFRDTFQFIGDQGRDALIVLHIIRDHHPVLIGPVTSTGNMYLGPLYYYMMVPSLLLTYPSPFGPGYAIAVLSLFTLFLTYFLGKELVGKRAALIAAAFMSISSTVIEFSRFSWNPNPAPFFGLLLLWASNCFWTKNRWYLVLMTFCVAVLVQLHYVTLLAAGGAGIIWFIALIHTLRKEPQKTRSLLFATGVSVALFIVSLTPLILFDLRHQFLNVHSFIKFISENQGMAHTSNWEKMLFIFHGFDGRAILILFEMFIGKVFIINVTLFVTTFLFFLLLCIQQRKSQFGSGYIVLLIYFSISIFGLTFYRSAIFFHYLGYLFPATLLFYGVIISKLCESKLGKTLAVIFALGYISWNFSHMPFKSLSWTVDDVEKASKTIASRVKPGEKYNIVLLTATGDIEGQNYRYFLHTANRPTLPQERWGETETLFIINEDLKLKRVVDSPIYEIVVFPNKTLREVYTIPNGPEITVLRK